VADQFAELAGKQLAVAVKRLAEATLAAAVGTTVAVGVVEVAGLVEAADADAGVHLVLAEDARVVEVAELVVLGQVLLVGAATQRLQVREAGVVDGSAQILVLDAQHFVGHRPVLGQAFA